MNVNLLNEIIACLATAVIGIYPYARRRNNITKYFAVANCTLAIWNLGEGLTLFSSEHATRLLLYRLSYIAGILLVPSFFRFTFAFMDIETDELKKLWKWILFSCFSLLLVSQSKLFIPDIKDSPRLPIVELHGPLYPVFIVYLLVFLGYALYRLFMSYKSSQGHRKDQYRYLIAAFSVALAEALLFFTSSSYLSWNYYYYLQIVYVFLISYAILAHQLMDIRIILQKTLVYSFLGMLAIVIYVVCVAHFTRRAMLPLSNISILTAVFSLTMSIFVLAKNPLKRLNIMWSLCCLGIAIWSLGFGMTIRSSSFLQGHFWHLWFIYPGSLLIPLLFLQFVGLLVKQNVRIVLVPGYAIASIIQGLAFMGKMGSLVPIAPFNYYPIANSPFYPLYFLDFTVLAIYSEWLLYKRLKTVSGSEKTQIRYLFLGTSLGFCGGTSTFLISFHIQVFPLGVYVIPIFLLTITYAIFKHHLLDINIALRKSLVYSLMTGFLTAIYLVTVTQGARFLQNYFAASTLTISIISACFITAIFLPLRNQVQSFVDRFFFRDWSDQPVAREIAAGFSHELKSPLAGLSMQAQLALAELEEVEEGKTAWLKALPKIKKELQYLVNQSMDAARRIEAVRGVAEPTRGQMEAVQVGDLMDNSLSTLQLLLGQVKAAIHRDLPEGLSPIYGDAKQLEIVFINLMKNALQAMDGFKGSHDHALTVSGQEQDGSVVISIKDTGPGIAARDVNRIFEPYFTTKGHKGTGMGLYLAQQIVKAHNGSIEVRSEEGKGTEFIVRLPSYNRRKSGVHEAA